MTNVIKLPRPKTYTTPELMLERVREEMFGSKDTNKRLAEKCNVSTSTIYNLMSGKTRWPRPTTLFPVLDALNLELRIVKKVKHND
jgi:transcriptional regulator with XRE-family HTH domain